MRENREREHTGSSPHSDEQQARARRRGATLEDAILEAAWDELVAVGYAHFTIDGVAARAQTSKPVLYRRWPNRPSLVLAALRHHGPILSGPVPDTGSLRGDVLAVLFRMSERFASRDLEVLYGLFANYLHDDELFAYVKAAIRPVGSEVMATILKRAAERGEVERDVIPPRIATLPIDLMRHELLMTRAPAPESVILEIVDDIFLPLVQRTQEQPSI
jgi:AcrR family transcriptional regulator